MSTSSLTGRSVGIRTRGLLVPNQARYQTSPHPETTLNIIHEYISKINCFLIKKLIIYLLYFLVILQNPPKLRFGGFDITLHFFKNCCSLISEFNNHSLLKLTVNRIEYERKTVETSCKSRKNTENDPNTT